MSKYPLPHPDRINAIIFDFGGVLFNIDYEAPARAFKALGMTNFEEIYAQAAQTPLFDDLEKGTITNEDFIQKLASYLPRAVSPEEILEAWNVILLDIPKERIDLIHALKARYRTFLLSNTNAIHVKEFEQIVDATMGLEYFRSAFEKVYYSNDLGIKKPYPETYLKVCEWNDLDPKKTLFIDDSEQHVRGAKEAGLWAYHLDVKSEDVCDTLQDFLP